jgi:lipopolysaccharide export system permease protein
VLCEVAVACALSVLLFVVLLLAGNAMRDIVEWVAMGRLSLGDVLRMLWILIPSAISYSLPLGMMSAIFIVIGRMSSQNEIIAMKSSGISLWEITRPIWALSAAFAALSMCINLYHAPNSISKYRQFFREMVREKPMRFIVPKMFNDRFSDYVIYADDISGEQFKGMKIWQINRTGDLDAYITARSGTVAFDGETDTLSLHLNDGNAEKFSATADGRRESQIIFFGNVSVDLPFADIVGRWNDGVKKLHRMTLSELLAAKKLLNSKANEMPRFKIRDGKTLINVQISVNVIHAVGILIMTMLAIPLAIKVHRADTVLNIGIALILCFGNYFAIAMLSLLGNKPDIRPHILIWIPSVALTALGALLFRRASRH